MRKEFTCFQSSNKLADARKEMANSLIKNLTPFEDDTETRLHNFLMYANSQKILLSR